MIGGTEIITVIDFGEPKQINSSNANFNTLKNILINIAKDTERQTTNGSSISESELSRIQELVDTKARVQNFLGDSAIELRGSSLYYEGRVLEGFLSNLIIRMVSEGQPNVQPLVNFLERLQMNPSYRVRDQLFKFLDFGKNSITPDGCFLGYKYVTDDFQSVHAGAWEDGTFYPDRHYDHSVGERPSMPREHVDDDPNNTCSSGLHVCSRTYLGHMGNNRQIVVCKVDPRDVVSVPVDYNNTKMRTCGYTVVGSLEKEQVDNDSLAASSVNSDYEKKSSFIEAVFWDNRYVPSLCIRFSSGSVYKFQTVLYSTYEKMLESEDWSSFFHEKISGVHEGVLVNG
jgi:hypothetical protein